MTGKFTNPPASWFSSGIIRFAHPEVGQLRLAYETLDLPADDDQRLIVHLPADAATSAALDPLGSHRPHPYASYPDDG